MTTIFESLASTPTTQQYAAKQTELKNWLSLKLPTLDVNDPVLVSALLGPMAEYLTDQAAVLASYEEYGRLASNVVETIESDDLQDQLRESLAAALGITQSAPGFAVGELQLVLTSAAAVAITAGTVFNSGQVQYQTPTGVILRVAAEQTGSTSERTLSPRSDGTWIATVPLVAITPGSAGNIAAGAPLTSSLALANLRSSTAAVNFIGGRDANTLQDLIDAVFADTAAKTLGTRDQIVAYTLSRSDIGNVRQVGVIGFGDPEMQRDLHPFLPIQSGGRADIYLASEFVPTQQTVELDGVLQSKTATAATVVVGVGRDVSPGYLRVLSVVDVTTGLECRLLSDVRGMDISPILGEQVPQITVAKHAAFSRFQTSTLTVEVPVAVSESAGAARRLAVTFQRVPGIDAAQQAFTSRTSRYVSGDTLVRSAIPLFLQIRVNLLANFDASVPDAASIKTAVADEIMRRPMRETVYRSDITQVIARYLPDDLAVDEIEYEGLLIGTDGKQRRLNSKGEFTVPLLLEDQLSPRTIAMYTSVSDVQVIVARRVTFETP